MHGVGLDQGDALLAGERFRRRCAYSGAGSVSSPGGTVKHSGVIEKSTNRTCLWRPGVELIARLIARILGRPQSDPAACIQALLLISSLLAFQSGRSVSLRTMRWSSIGPKELTMVLTQIDAIGQNPDY
jgi:HTH-type transcriptional dual regulator CecR, C-terminal domain